LLLLLLLLLLAWLKTAARSARVVMVGLLPPLRVKPSKILWKMFWLSRQLLPHAILAVVCGCLCRRLLVLL
jgi:hypothetical protein